MQRGEIWRVDLDPVVGHEQRGSHSVLIVSPHSFNRLTNKPIVLPITTGGRFARLSGFAVSLEHADIKTRGIVLCDQPRAIDLYARNGSRVEEVPQNLIDDVLARVATIFD